MPSFTTLSIAAAAIAATGLAACGSDDPKSPAKTATGKATVLSIVTSDAGAKRFAMAAPASIKGGLVRLRFRNASTVSHEAQLIRVDGQRTAAEVLKVVDTGDEPAKIPAWVHAEGGVSAIPGGAVKTTTANLPAGTYFVIDTEADNPPSPSDRGAIAQFTVTPGSDGPLPATAGTITVADDGKDHYRFETTGLTAGTRQVTFKNASRSDNALHHVVAFPIAPGKTIADVRQAFASRNPSGPPPLDFANGTSTEVLDAGRSLVTTLTLKKGSYALLCFLNDRDETKPHFMEGLLTKVDIS
jgi:hypothetical protein